MENIIQLSGLQVTVVLVAIGILQFLLANWIKSRIQYSIKHEYDKKIEEYKFSQLQRQKAESVANLFAHWIKYRGKETELLSKKEQFEYYEALNRMSIEIALWIKDETLLSDLMARLQNKQDAKSIHDLVGDVRKLILSDTGDSFNSDEIVIWPTDDILNDLLKNDTHKRLSD